MPQALVVAVVTPPPGVPGGVQVDADRLNRIWSELASLHGYRQYALAPDQSGAEFTGASQAEGLVIRPPLIQLRDKISFTAGQSAEKLQDGLKVVMRHLGVNQIFNLGIRHIYHATTPENDGRGFVMHRVLGKVEDEIAGLSVGERLWLGLKLVTGAADRQYTLVVEPLQADERLLYVDLDAQFPGQASPDAVKERAHDAEQYLTTSVRGYLDQA